MYSQSFFRGKQHPDTQSFSEEGDLQQHFQGHPFKIQEIIVARTPNNIIGLQVVYAGIGSSYVHKGHQHFGKEKHDHSVSHETVRLNNDEYLVEIFGRNGDIFDNIGFRTSTGNSYDFGGSGGEPFSLKAPQGKHFNVLRGGYGGHLHFIDFLTAPIANVISFSGNTNFNPSQGYNTNQGFQPQSHDEFYRGKTHSDTVKFNDHDLVKNQGNYKLESISILTDGTFIFGLIGRYRSFSTGQRFESKHIGKFTSQNLKEERFDLQNTEYITEIYGGHGDLIDRIGFATNMGNRFQAGGQGGGHFEVRAPSGRHFAYLRGGFGGHLHNVDFGTEPIYQKPQTFQEQEFRRGKTHSDTVQFSDLNVLRQYPPSYKIWKITVFHDRKLVYGWQADYFVFGPNVVVKGERHLGSHWAGGVEDVVELSADEFITEIFGRNGDVLDNFGFATSKGRRFDFGGPGGAPFDARAPHGYHFAALGGGLGGHVHNVEFNPVPLGFFLG